MLYIAILLCLAVFVLIGVGWYRSSSKYAVGQRIEQIREETAQSPEEELSKPFFQRVILPMGEGVARVFRGSTPAESAERIQKKLIRAGLFPRVTPVQFQGLCWASMVACAVGMFTMLLLFGNSPTGRVDWGDPLNLVCIVSSFLGGYMLPQFILSKKVTARQQAILLTLPYTIDLLSISVEAGLGFDAAVGYTMRKVKGPLSDEFAKTLNEIRLGKPRLEALEDLGNRTGVEELKIFITAVVHASRLGGSITNTLRVQADSIRVRHRQRVQEQAMKAPVKMVIPLVFFIFPALFVVILGPALIAIWRQI